VAITNAVAEAKVEWQKEIMAQVSSLKRRSRAGFENGQIVGEKCP